MSRFGIKRCGPSAFTISTIGENDIATLQLLCRMRDAIFRAGTAGSRSSVPASATAVATDPLVANAGCRV
ncbi:hypothetical protein BN903_11 [Halorubrum sp. AJ67]|nr:hypothetical protein BN903_11 [Halorubrum sp. AJ67]